VGRLPRQALQEQHALVQRRQRASQRVSQRCLLIRRDALRREPVTHLASDCISIDTKAQPGKVSIT
jgi:hypothetical protein